MRASNSLRCVASAWFLCLGPAATEAQISRETTDDVTVRRLANNPIVTADLSPGIGINIQGPSLIRVPDWLPNPLGRYYLYFHPADEDDQGVVLVDVRWNSEGTAERTLTTMSRVELRKRLRSALRRGDGGGGRVSAKLS